MRSGVAILIIILVFTCTYSSISISDAEIEKTNLVNKPQYGVRWSLDRMLQVLDSGEQFESCLRVKTR